MGRTLSCRLRRALATSFHRGGPIPGYLLRRRPAVRWSPGRATADQVRTASRWAATSPGARSSTRPCRIAAAGSVPVRLRSSSVPLRPQSPGRFQLRHLGVAAQDAGPLPAHLARAPARSGLLDFHCDKVQITYRPRDAPAHGGDARATASSSSSAGRRPLELLDFLPPRLPESPMFHRGKRSASAPFPRTHHLGHGCFPGARHERRVDRMRTGSPRSGFAVAIHVEDTWDDFDRLAPNLNRRLEEWRRNV